MQKSTNYVSGFHIRFLHPAALLLFAATLSVHIGCQSENGQAAKPPADISPVDTLPPTAPSSPAAIIPRRNVVVDDPNSDGWTTEAFSQRASESLNQIIENAIRPSASNIASDTAEFQSTEILPEDLEQVSELPLQVLRWRPQKTATLGKRSLFSFVADRVRMSDAQGVSSKVKITGVDPTDADRPKTELRLEFYNKSPQRTVQVTATADAVWQPPASDDAPLVLSTVELTSFEQATIESKHETWFREVTPCVMKHVPSYTSQLLFDDDYWSQRIERRLGANFMGNHGVAVGDVNGDLLDDLYVSQNGGIPNRLYLQQPDGTLQEATDSGVDILDATRAALLIDIDNDGDQDLVVASITGTLFYENTGDAKFEFRYREPGVAFGYSIVAADYDLDGDLDIYICCYNGLSASRFPNPVPYHDARNGPPNALIANDGDWQFHNATEESGLNVENDRWTYAASWQDVDSDGDPDLYVPNDFGRNWLYINEGGKFTNRAAELGVEDIASGMSAAWGDYNRDGRMDVYVSNMFSSAGNRVTYQRKFKEESQAETKQSLQRLARGNTLFEAQSDGSFRDVTMAAKVEMGRWAWSSNFIDFNNDGWQDLVVANGNYTGTDTGDL